MSSKITCPNCQTVTLDLADSCPNCGTKFIKKKENKIFKILGIVLVCFIIIGAISDDSDSNSKQQIIEQTHYIGDDIEVGDVRVRIINVQIKQNVGSYMISSPSSGGIYVIVDWSYINSSDKPISSFSLPRIHLIDPKGHQYDNDIGASGSYATEVRLDTKIFSDLNPGIKSRDADVFEVSDSQFDRNTWKIQINQNGKTADVNL